MANQDRKQLPLGSIVKINHSDTNLMIVSHFPIATINNQQGYFDFGATRLPEGMINQELILFNREDILEIIFIGYIDVNFQNLLNNQEKIIENIPYKKFTSSSLSSGESR